MNRLHLPRRDQVVLTAARGRRDLLHAAELGRASPTTRAPTSSRCSGSACVTAAVGLALRTLGRRDRRRAARADARRLPGPATTSGRLERVARWLGARRRGLRRPAGVGDLRGRATRPRSGRAGAHGRATELPARSCWPSASVVVLLVDLLACTLRRVPLAGLPLLAAFTVPVSLARRRLVGDVRARRALLRPAAHRGPGRAPRPVGPHPGADLDAGRRRRRQPAPPGPARHAVALGDPASRVAGVALAVRHARPAPPAASTCFGGNGTGDGARDGDSVTLRNPMVDVQRRPQPGRRTSRW